MEFMCDKQTLTLNPASTLACQDTSYKKKTNKYYKIENIKVKLIRLIYTLKQLKFIDSFKYYVLLYHFFYYY